MRHHERGAALGFVIMMSLMFSVGVAAVMLMAGSAAQRGAQSMQEMRATFALNTGMQWAKQQLMANPTFSTPPGGTNVSFDANGNGTIEPDEQITVTIPLCPAPPTPCPSRRITVKTTL